MFSNRIANSARFLQMPTESQLLYFHFVLRADDDGIVESYPILRLLGLAPDSYKVLKAKGFVRELNEDQVIVITDWLEHNVIRADRKVDSIYKNLLVEKYPEIPVIEAKARSDVKDNSARLNSGQSTDSISKVKLSKVKLSKDNIERESHALEIEEKQFSKKSDITDFTIREISEQYEVPVDFVADCWDSAKNWLEANGKHKKNYRSYLINWVKRDKAKYILEFKKGSRYVSRTADLSQIGK